MGRSTPDGEVLGDDEPGVMAEGGVCPWLQGEETPPPMSVGGGSLVRRWGEEGAGHVPGRVKDREKHSVVTKVHGLR